MKRTIKLLSLVAALAMFALPVLAQAKECTDEFKTATYSKWYENRKEHQDVAYQAAKDYLATCPTDESQYATALKKFAADYDRLNKDVDTGKQFEAAFKAKNYADEMRLGKLVVASNPDSTAVYIIMGVAGLGDPAVLADSVQYAKKAIEMIEGGKPFAPYDTKDRALAALNYAVGKANLQNAPGDALPNLIKAARYDSDLKKSPQTYLDILTAYEKGPRAKQTEAYESQYKGKPETPESKLALANLDQIIDREIDAYARLAALTTNPTDKKSVMDELTTLYKYRNKSETGLNELLASVLSKPLPDVPTPLTSLPATPASTTPASSGSQSGTTGTGQPPVASGTAKPAGTLPGKPVASPTPANKKPRRAHHGA